MRAKTTLIFLTFSLLLFSNSANAWFFLFIPGALTSKIGDAITGAEGDSCVKEGAKVGDVLTSQAGNKATIKSLSGTSGRCRNPDLPIRALLEFQYTFSSKAGIEIPDGFKPLELTSTQRFNGILLHAKDNSRQIEVYISARPKNPGTDGGTLAKNIANNILSLVDDGKTSNAEELTINGAHAYRFEATGKNKGMFGRNFTYIVTVLEGANEYVVVNANSTADRFQENSQLLKQLAYDVKGLATEDKANLSSASPRTPASTVEVQSSSLVTHTPESKVVQESAKAQTGLTQTDASAVSQQMKSSRNEGIVEKLRVINGLFKEGLIDKEEYERKKEELLKGL